MGLRSPRLASVAVLVVGPALSVGCGGNNGSSTYDVHAEGGITTDATTYTDDGGGASDGPGSSDVLSLGCGTLATCQVACPDGGADGGGGTTSLSGVVYDPAGKVPLYNVIVYVPTTPVSAMTTGATCDPCGGDVTGNPLVSTLTDPSGHFVLPNVPVGVAIPLVMQLGKWRRQVTIPAIPSSSACHDTVLTDGNVTRLPRNRTEGDLPHIALTTGGADPLECLLRKIGIDDSEFSTAGGSGRVHLYAGYGVQGASPPLVATASFASSLNGGVAFATAPTLWDSAASLEAYDIVLMACQGAPTQSEGDGGTEPATALQAMYDFESQGGRVFASHWHDYWFEDGPTPVPSTGSWTDLTPPPPNPSYGTIDTSFPKGQAFHDWMSNVRGLESDGTLQIYQPKHNLNSVGNGAQQWVTVPNPNAGDAGSSTAVEYMSFNTPLDVDAGSQCGRVVYSDLHVSSGATSDAGTQLGDLTGEPFPTGCVTADLSPQEKALEFMLFDLSSCIQSDSQPPMPPQ
jgi:hypothetical protein